MFKSLKINFRNKYILILILVLATFLRIWKLGDVPPSASMDEASIGYNAYSVSKIGVDEYGQFPLISQRAYDDWRRSTYLLLVVPFVRLLSLNVIAIRLPAVILSILTVYAAYRIVIFLFSKDSKYAESIALLVTFLLAISPWHIYISRLGHESNAYLSFFVFGVLFFLLGIKDKKNILFAIIFFILSMISYYAGQILVPLFILGIMLIYREFIINSLLKDKKMRVQLLLCALVSIPIFWSIFSPAALTRFGGTSTFKPDAHPQEYAEMINLRNKAAASHDIIGTVIYNRRLFPVRVFIEGYLSHFDPKWLFFNSYDEPFKVPRMGLLYLWELPFILIGSFALLFSKETDNRAKKLIFLWFFLAPFPASVATQAPHAMRVYAFLPTWQIFTAFGLFFILNKLRGLKLLGFAAFLVIAIVSLQSFYRNYYIIFPKEQSKSFEYALSHAIPAIVSKESSYNTIILSNENNLYQSYMLYLYYTRFDPLTYQRLGGTTSGGYAVTHKIGKYEFRPIVWNKERPLSKTLYAGNPQDFPKDISTLNTFYLLDGTAAVKLVSYPR